MFRNEECVCFSSIPLSCLRVGFRSLSLFEENEDNNYHIELLSLSKLFLRFGMSTNIDQQHQLQQVEQQQQSSSMTTPNSGSKSFSRSLTQGSDRSTDSNSRMVGMDVSPGTKNWDRYLNRRDSSEDGTPEAEEQNTNFKVQSPHRRQQSDKYVRRSSSNDRQSGTITTPLSPLSTTATTITPATPEGVRSRERRKSSRNSERVRRDRSTSRSQSVDR